MASEFLKRKAEERAKRIDKKYGEGTYGSTADLNKKREENKKKKNETDNTKYSEVNKALNKAKQDLKAAKIQDYENKLKASIIDSQDKKVEMKERDLPKVRSNVLNKEPDYPYINAPIRANVKDYAINDQANMIKKAERRAEALLSKREAENKDTWFKGGSFADGYDFWDFTKTTLGSVGDLSLGMVKGVGRTVEGLVDLGMYGVAGVADLFDADDFAKKTKNAAIYSATDEWTKPVTDFVDKYSVLGNKSDAVSEGLGQIALILATGGAGAAAGLGTVGTTALTTGVTTLSTAGTNMGEAYKGGATDGEAALYGATTGLFEGGIELVSGGLGKSVKALGISRGIGGLDDLFAKKLSNKVAGMVTSESTQKLITKSIETGVKSFGEGSEEVLSGAFSALMKKMTYMDNEELSKLIEDENLLDQFIVGTVCSSVTQTTLNSATSKKQQNEILDTIRDNDEILDALISEGKASGEGSVSSKIAEEVAQAKEKGKVTREQVKRLIAANDADIKAEEQAKVQAQAEEHLAETKKAERKAEIERVKERLGYETDISKETRETRKAERKAEIEKVKDRLGYSKDPLADLAKEVVEKETRKSAPTTIKGIKKATGFGTEGARLVSTLMDSEGMSFGQAEGTVKTAYLAGTTNLEKSKVNFTSTLQEQAFNAGKKDRIVDDTIAKANVKKAAVYDGVFTENEYTKNFTDAEKKMISTVAKHLGMDVSVVDKIIANKATGAEANAEHQDGKMRISSTAEQLAGQVIHELVMHESGHRMKQLAPTEFGVLMDALYERSMRENAKAGIPLTANYDYVKAEHDRADITMNTSGYMEEFAVRELETIFGSAEEFNKWVAEIDSKPQIKSAWQRFVDWLSEVIEDIKAALGGKMSKTERAEAKRELAELDRIMELLEGTYKSARDAATELKANQNTEANAKPGSETSFSLSSAKIKRLSDIILKMSKIKKLAGDKEIRISTDQFSVDKAIHSTKGRTAREVNARRNAIPEFETMIRQSIYSHTDTDIRGLDKEAKKGVIAMHYFKTTYNGYDIEVVVRDKGKKQFLYEVKFIENKKSSQQGMPNDIDSPAPKGDAENSYKIPQNQESVKRNFSLKDSDGNILTEGQKDKLGRTADAKSSESLEIEGSEDYNSNVNYSLKWHTDLSRTQIKQVEKWIRQVGNSETTRITDTSNWYKGRIDGEELFVIYSDKSTILYERKGREARAELDILLEQLEEIENGRSIVEVSEDINTLLSGDWLQEKHNLANNNAGLRGRGSNTGYATVLQGKSSKFIGSQAFRNVVKNLFDIQEKAEELSRSKSHSLKGGLSNTEIREKIAEYADGGKITTEKYNELIKTYGAIPSGETPHRDVSVPAKTEKDKKVSQTVRTILEAKATPDELVPTVEKMVEDGIFSYDVYTDKQAIGEARDKLKNEGWIDAYNSWMKKVEQGVVSKELTAQGWALYNNAANRAAEATDETAKRDATQTALSILDAMVRHQRNAAQALQATRILKNLSPETQLYGIQKSVSAFQKELKEKYGKKAPDLKIDEELAEQFIKAKTEEERTKVEKEIFKDIGRQMPSTFMDKWNAWRYLAMLANPRTHVRNIVGNAFFAPVVITKDLTATVIEAVVHRVSGKKMLRGKSIVWGSKNDRALLKAAWSDYANVADMVSNGGKYSDFAMKNQYIEEGRKIFKSKLFAPVEWARKGNSKALEAEDVWFSKPHYAYALAQYCKANNITAEQIQKGKAIAPAREYAIKEAQKATYKDTNAFSQMVSEWGRNNNENNAVKKAANTVVEGVLPFRKTPANILVRGVEYSPLGLLKGLSYDLVQVGKGEMTASQAIDNISAGLTGTGLVALGVYLAAQGLIRGHGEDEEEERKFKEMQGHQAYSLELPNGTSVTLDWLAPEALPFFVGVNLWEVTEGSKKEANLASILNSVKNISEPMLEMSCLQGLNDLIEGVGNASSEDTSGIVAIGSSAITSYLSQGIPTLFGQAERTGEENRMTTYTEKNDFLTGDLQYTLGKSSAKIPYWDYNQIPYIDAWGRKEASGPALKRGLNNFLNPAYTSKIESSEMEKELLRLYEQTGESKVFPERADKYFTVDGVRKDLTADEYVKYATLKGQNSYKMVTELVESKAYKELTDEEKVKAISDAYDYANQKAKKAISNYKPEKWVEKADEFGDVDSYIFFRTNVTEVRESNDGSIKKADVVDIIGNTTQDDSEAWDLYLSMYDYPQAHEAEKHGIDANTYMNAVVAMYDIHSDYYYNGKIVDGKDLTADQRKNLKYVRNSRRRKVEEYLNSVCTSYKDYLFLLGTEYSSITDDADYVSYFGRE